jgi:hypothetical protein
MNYEKIDRHQQILFGQENLLYPKVVAYNYYYNAEILLVADNYIKRYFNRISILCIISLISAPKP